MAVACAAAPLLLVTARMKSIVIAAVVLSGASTVASADPGRPLEPAPAVSVGSFAYAIRGYLSSTVAILPGIDAAYDHDLGPSFGLRVRTGVILLGIDEITGTAPHGEAGVFHRHRISERAAVDASLLAGYYRGGLDHKEEWVDHAGPTAMAELAIVLEPVDRIQLAVGSGYRLAWTAEEHVSDVGSTEDPFSSGPLVRFNLGVSF
jgi:hypothetical protein